MDLCRALLASGTAVRLRVRGSSMRPAIRDGDLLTVEPISHRSLARGEVVVFVSGTRIVAHRVLGEDAAGQLICRGDYWPCKPEAVACAAILGTVVGVGTRGAPPRRGVQLARWAGWLWSSVVRGPTRAVFGPHAVREPTAGQRGAVPEPVLEPEPSTPHRRCDDLGQERHDRRGRAAELDPLRGSNDALQVATTSVNRKLVRATLTGQPA